jgi:7-carboxy-7-deazaguanine synthase
MKYPVAERFKSIQGEGLYCGTPMAFIRFVGCSVGKDICHACDADFEQIMPERGGGLFSPEELRDWVGDYRYVCLTGGEPLDRNLRPLLDVLDAASHVETSGTRQPDWLASWRPTWITVSPKPGFNEPWMLEQADEIKMIVGGLGAGPGWPAVEDAIRWANAGKLVYLQPRNLRAEIDPAALQRAADLVLEHPQLRLSPQLHKYAGMR